MGIVDDLKDARQRSARSQRDVARRSGITQPALAALEAGRGNPTLDTLERWARALDLELAALPRPSDPMVEVATALSDADDPLAFRLGLELLDRLREMGEEEFTDVVSHAPRTSSERYDALIAAVVELICIERSMAPPAWCAEPIASPMWWVSPLPSARRHALATCPAPFRARGIMIDEVDVMRA